MGERYVERESRDEWGEDRKDHGGFKRRKVCRFCNEKEKAVVDYRDTAMMHSFTSERGKIVPRRVSGTCSKHQRSVAQAVKRARAISLVPFVVHNA